MRTGAVCFCLFFVCCVYAQDVRLSVDQEGGMFAITPALAGELDLFRDTPMFQEARLFRQADSTFALEIHRIVDYHMVVERRPASDAEFTQLRQAVSRSTIARLGDQAPSRHARTRFVLGSAALGLVYYGIALPMAANVEGGGDALALYFLSGTVAFALPLALTSQDGIPAPSATLSIYGGSRGILHGLALWRLLDKDGEPTGGYWGRFPFDPELRSYFSTGAAVGAAEMISGYHLAKALRLSTGTAATMATVGDLGLLAGGSTGYLIGKNQNGPPRFHGYLSCFGDDDYDDGQAPQRHGLAGGALAGSAVGMAAGAWLASGNRYTKGDTRVLRAAGIVGVGVAYSLRHLVRPEREKDEVPVAIAIGSVGGVAAGHVLIAGRSFTDNQGMLVLLSTLTGALAGTGLSSAIDTHSQGNFEHQGAVITALAAGGFSLGYLAFQRWASDSTRLAGVDVSVRAQGDAPSLDLRVSF